MLFLEFLSGPGQNKLQVAMVSGDAKALLQSKPASSISTNLESFPQEQFKDEQLNEVIQFIETKKLPLDKDSARKIALQTSLFVIVDAVLYSQMQGAETSGSA